MNDRAPLPVDLHVGGRIRARRKILGVSLESLSDDIGVSYQQTQKYERGANRVSASKLYDIAKSLQVSIAYFFDGLADPSTTAVGAESGASTDVHAFLMTPEGIELAAVFPKIKRGLTRRRLLDLVRAVAGDEDEEAAPALRAVA